jgi:hypothetical protein
MAMATETPSGPWLGLSLGIPWVPVMVSAWTAAVLVMVSATQKVASKALQSARL